jgi:hypothetical protein
LPYFDWTEETLHAGYWGGLFVFVFKRFIVPSSMHLQHHYRKNIQNKIKSIKYPTEQNSNSS